MDHDKRHFDPHAISENGYVSLYWYDADGNRTVKEHGGGEAVWVNSRHAGTTTDTVTYSIYPNPYISITGNRWTKHYYIGGERFASSTGTLSDFNDLNDSNNAAAGHGIADVNYDSICQAEEDSINSIYSHFDVPYEARHINTRGNGWHLYLPATHEDEGNDGNETAEILEKEQLRNDPTALVNGQMYFYQRDHLGSTMLVTDSIGNTVQLVEYTPWGEVFVERRFGTSGFDTPYLFNGKELDEETGLYYYGARYYDPKMSVWYSTDPMEEKYPYLTSYGYVYNNPIKLIDPNGKTPWGAIVEGVGAFFVNAGIDFFTKWIFEGQNIKTAYNNINWGAATFDGLSTAALSFFVDGTGSAKNLNKIASSKPGRFALDVSQIMATNIISKIEMGASLRDIRWRDELLYASFSKCISLGMESKANELLELLKESNSKMYNAAKKLQRNIEAGKNDARINSDRNQVKITSTNALKNSLSYGKETTKNRAVSGSLTGVIRHDNESIRHDD